jgi:hypothetical protein
MPAKHVTLNYDSRRRAAVECSVHYVLRWSVPLSLVTLWAATFLWRPSVTVRKPVGDGTGSHYVDIEFACGQFRLRSHWRNPDGMKLMRVNLNGETLAAVNAKQNGVQWGISDSPNPDPMMYVGFHSPEPKFGPILGLSIWSEHVFLRPAPGAPSAVTFEDKSFGLVLPTWLMFGFTVSLGLVVRSIGIRLWRVKSTTSTQCQQLTRKR